MLLYEDGRAASFRVDQSGARSFQWMSNGLGEVEDIQLDADGNAIVFQLQNGRAVTVQLSSIMNGRFRDESVSLLEPVDMDDELEVEGESTEGLPSISSELSMQVASSDTGWIARHD